MQLNKSSTTTHKNHSHTHDKMHNHKTHKKTQKIDKHLSF
jgi:hypothetical protein